MRKTILATAIAAASVAMGQGVWAAAIYDEGVSGDLSNLFSSPDDLTGFTQVTGSVLNSDLDYFSFSGMQAGPFQISLMTGIGDPTTHFYVTDSTSSFFNSLSLQPNTSGVLNVPGSFSGGILRIGVEGEAGGEYTVTLPFNVSAPSTATVAALGLTALGAARRRKTARLRK